MARVVALIPDLLFGSHVQGQLAAAEHEVELVGDLSQARERLQDGDLLVVDLIDPDLDAAEVLGELTATGALERVRTLGFFAHVDPEVRARALSAGFDLVVPRSRMAREGAELVRRLLA